jgi:hypothetical protein
MVKRPELGLMMILLLAAISWWMTVDVVNALSSPIATTLGDRFHATCPADLASIESFDASLLTKNTDNDTIWVAVFRSQSTTPPSVLLRDEFLQSMKEATSSDTNNKNNLVDSLLAAPVAQTPIAVACLTPTSSKGNCWLLDNLRCSLEKEQQNEECDGGSEYVEALGLCVDSLLIEYLKTHTKIHNRIRSKATLHSSRLLEARGFCEIDTFSMDMATHVSKCDAMLQHYQQRANDDTTTLPISSVQRAKEILQQLESLEEKPSSGDDDDDDNAINDEETEYDPWSGMKQFL